MDSRLLEVVSPTKITLERFNFDQQEWLAKGMIHTSLKRYHTIIQVLCGRYEILTPAGSINVQNGEIMFMGAARPMQLRIHNDLDRKLVKTRWLELDIRIHQSLDFISMINIPTVLDWQTAAKISEIFEEAYQDKYVKKHHGLYLGWNGIQQNALGFSTLRALLATNPLKRDWKELSQKSNDMEKILTFIHKNFRRKITVQELAGKACLSIKQFSENFRKAFHERPLKYIQNLRVGWVVDQLVLTDKTLSQIAEEAGFSSQFHMSRDFSQKFKAPPATFRREFRSQLENVIQKNQSEA